MNEFDKKTVLVTGASGGIGRAIAKEFALRKARVAVHYNSNRDGADQTLKQLDGDGHTKFSADLTKAEQCQQIVKDVAAEFGSVDILVNNAGIFDLHPIQELDYTEWQTVWRKTISSNLLGPAFLIYCAVSAMTKTGRGKIINISSRGAFRGEPQAPAYGASKAGLNALSQSLAVALAPQNIFVHVVAPGFVDTERVAPILNGPEGEEIRKQSPLGRVALPEEIAHAVVMLASKKSDFMTGCIVDVNGASYLRT